VLARATGIALAVARAGLPAQATQRVVLLHGQLVPLIAGRVPELVEQPMLGADHPVLHLRGVGQALARFGNGRLTATKRLSCNGSVSGRSRR
jgi:hypothetical protein